MPLPPAIAAMGLTGPVLAAIATAIVVAIGVGVYEYSKPDPEPHTPPAVARTEAPAAGAEQPESAAPSFDVFRVEPDGSVVAAGRAAPGARVDLVVNGDVFDTAQASDAGEWAMAPDRKLPAGSHDVTLRGSGEGQAVASEGALSVVLDGESTPLVALAEPGRPARIMQQPETERQAALAEPRDTAVQGQTAQAGPEQAAAPSPQPAPATGSEAAPEQAPAGAEEEAAASPPPAQAAEDRAEERAGERVEERGEKAAGEDAPAAAAPEIAIAGVEVEGDGLLHVQGRAPAAGAVRVYLNDAPIGDVRAGADGAFALTAQRTLDPGRYEVRADLLDAAGAVVARAEVKFDRVRLAEAGQPVAEAPAASGGAPDAQPAGGEGAPAQVDAGQPDLMIERGDNLWRIARRLYGRGIRYTVIYEANRSQIRNPDLIYPGQVFTIPVIEDEKTR